MYKQLCRLLIDNGARLIYTTSRATGHALEILKKENPDFYSEVSINEKTAYELALTGGMVAKRTACIFSTEGLYEALDPVMSSAYTGTVGGFLIICLQETEEEVTPMGLFSKLPLIVAERAAELARSMEFGYYLSEKYEIPVIIQAAIDEGDFQGSGVRFSGHQVKMNDEKSSNKKVRVGSAPLDNNSEFSSAGAFGRAGKIQNSKFTKNPARWAATPKFRYQLHKLLNEKREKIREEFEQYEGNILKVMQGKTGIITNKHSYAEFYGEDTSVLYISTVYPLPAKLVDTFIGQMDKVFVIEGEYPAIELQIRNRTKIKVEHMEGVPERVKPEETMYGFEVVRDTLGGASSISMAHGIKKSDPHKKILAITFEDHFFHSGMPAFVNTLYNNSSYVLLILTNEREDEIKKIMEGCGFNNFFHIENTSEIERFYKTDELIVLFCRGII
jgi:TPP-dependent indolepyruvate ferredoxin oxidoreductase alpha subunit